MSVFISPSVASVPFPEGESIRLSSIDVRTLQDVADSLRSRGAGWDANRICEILAMAGEQCLRCGCWRDARDASCEACTSLDCYCRYCRACHEYPCACD